MKAAGAWAPTNHSISAPTRNTIAVDLADAGAPPPPCPWLLAGTAAFTAAAGFAGGAADSFGGGGGQVMAPSLITVVPRITSSSMLTSMTPSFALQSSSVRRSRLVAYRVLACFESRLGRSV